MKKRMISTFLIVASLFAVLSITAGAAAPAVKSKKAAVLNAYRITTASNGAKSEVSSGTFKQVANMGYIGQTVSSVDRKMYTQGMAVVGGYAYTAMEYSLKSDPDNISKKSVRILRTKVSDGSKEFLTIGDGKYGMNYLGHANDMCAFKRKEKNPKNGKEVEYVYLLLTRNDGVSNSEKRSQLVLLKIKDTTIVGWHLLNTKCGDDDVPSLTGVTLTSSKNCNGTVNLLLASGGSMYTAELNVAKLSIKKLPTSNGAAAHTPLDLDLTKSINLDEDMNWRHEGEKDKENRYASITEKLKELFYNGYSKNSYFKGVKPVYATVNPKAENLAGETVNELAWWDAAWNFQGIHYRKYTAQDGSKKELLYVPVFCHIHNDVTSNAAKDTKDTTFSAVLCYNVKDKLGTTKVVSPGSASFYIKQSLEIEGVDFSGDTMIFSAICWMRGADKSRGQIATNSFDSYDNRLFQRG